MPRRKNAGPWTDEQWDELAFRVRWTGSDIGSIHNHIPPSKGYSGPFLNKMVRVGDAWRRVAIYLEGLRPDLGWYRREYPDGQAARVGHAYKHIIIPRDQWVAVGRELRVIDEEISLVLWEVQKAPGTTLKMQDRVVKTIAALRKVRDQVDALAHLQHPDWDHDEMETALRHRSDDAEVDVLAEARRRLRFPEA